jgi:predicted aconitase with swiveling domain
VKSDFRIHGQSLVPGSARGKVSALSSPLSLWGGFDLDTGTVSDVNHPQYGAMIAGRILVMPGGRGSSSSSSILLESARMSVNPSAIIMTEKDPIIVIGALVASDLYQVHIPVILIEKEDLDGFPCGMNLMVDATTAQAVMTNFT